MLDEFINCLRDDFKARLARKTGWGRNELFQEFERCLTDCLVKLTEKPKEMESHDNGDSSDYSPF